MIASIRNENQAVLLLDCGDVFDSQRDTAEFMLQTMGLMKYDALNLGIAELKLGPEFLEQSRAAVSFPYIASNLLYQGERPSWASEYIIREAGGLKVAILGLVDPDNLARALKQDGAKALQATPPEEALSRLLPEVRKKADMVILLSQLDETRLFALLKAVKGIDVSISSGKKARCGDKKAASDVRPPGNTVLLYSAPRGGKLGILKVTLDDKGPPVVREKQHLVMGSAVPGNEEMAGLVKTYKERDKIKKEQQQKDLREGLQLTPQEFMDRYQKEQNQKQKGAIQ